MKIDLFNTHQGTKLKETLRAYQLQYKAIAGNIANINNPSYQRVKTDFHDLLTSRLDHSKLKATSEKHFRSLSESPDGNLVVDKVHPEVDMNREMADLAENQIRYEFASRALRQLYSGLSSAILGRVSG